MSGASVRFDGPQRGLDLIVVGAGTTGLAAARSRRDRAADLPQTRLPWGDDAFAWRQGPVTAFAGNNVFEFAPVLGPLLVDAATRSGLAPELRPPPG